MPLRRPDGTISAVIRISVLAWLWALAALIGGCQSTAAGSGDPRASGDRVEGGYLIHLDSRAEYRPILEKAFGSYGLEDMDRLEMEKVVYRIRLTRDPGPETLRDKAESFSAIRRVEPNFKYSIPPQPGIEGEGPDPPPQ